MAPLRSMMPASKDLCVSRETPAYDLGSLFDAHASFVWRVLERHGVPTSELADGCQEVFIVVHRRLGDFEGRSSMRTWLYGIAVRVAASMRRKSYLAREQLHASPEVGSSAADQLEEVERNQQLALIESALRTLSADKREAFALYELEGMTMAEVAKALGIPENTALYRYYGARDAIRSFAQKRARPEAASAEKLYLGAKR